MAAESTDQNEPQPDTEAPPAAPVSVSVSGNLAGSYAALDLGSNSFHLIVAQYAEDRLQVVDKLKESVRIAAGLDEEALVDRFMGHVVVLIIRVFPLQPAGYLVW